jgi:hypothetical protein
MQKGENQVERILAPPLIKEGSQVCHFELGREDSEKSKREEEKKIPILWHIKKHFF